MSGKNEDVRLGERVQSFQELEQGFRLIERFPSRYGDAVGARNPLRDSFEDLVDGRDPAALCPSIHRDAAETTDRASLEPDADPPARAQGCDGEMDARECDASCHEAGSFAIETAVDAPVRISRISYRRPVSAPLSNKARESGLIRCASTWFRMPRPPFERSARHKPRSVALAVLERETS